MRLQPLAAIAASGLLAILLAALLAPWLAPAPPDAIDLAAQLAPPSPAHPLGADFYGRDLLSRILYGSRVTLLVATAAVALALVAGTFIGLLAGYAQGWASQAWVGLMDVLLAFPALLLALLVVALMGPGLIALAVAVGVSSIPGYARLVRSLVLILRSAPFVEAAVALGGATPHILGRHLLPAVFSPLLALATLDFGRAIISVAALGFLGLGAAPPTAEWGLMLFEGRGYLATAPWASAFPGLAITLTVLAVTTLGDALSNPQPLSTHQENQK
jgi:peptide/nickel transport system permease protein